MNPISIAINAFRDLKDMVGGVGQITGIGLSDLVHLATHPVSTIEHPSNLLSFQIAQNAPQAIASDYASRYGSVGGFLTGLQQHPLSFASDALAVASAGGSLAARSAAELAKAPEVVADLARIAEVGGDASKIADLAPATEKYLSIVGKPSAVLNTENIAHPVESIAPIADPYQRFIKQTIPQKLMTKPIEQAAVAAEQGATAAAMSGDEAAINAAKRASEAVQVAQEQGATRVLRPFIARHHINAVADSLFGGGNFIANRAQDTEALVAPVAEVLKQTGETPEAIAEIGVGFRPTAKDATEATNRAGFQDFGQIPTPVGDVVEARKRAMDAMPSTLLGFKDELGTEAAKARPGFLKPPSDTLTPDLEGYRFVTPDGDISAAQATIEKQGGQVVALRDAQNPRAIPKLYAQMPDGRTIEVQVGTPGEHIAENVSSVVRKQLADSTDPAALAKGAAYQDLVWDAAHYAGADPMTRYLADQRLAIANTLERKGFSTGDLSVTNAFDDIYLPLRQRAGATFDPTLGEAGEWVDAPGNSSLEIFDRNRAQGINQPVYTPMVAEDVVRPSAFAGAPKALKGQLITSRDPFTKRNTGALLANDAWLKDPATAYAIRAAKAVRAREAKNLATNLIDTFGRPLERLADGTWDVGDNELVTAPELLFANHRTKLAIEDEMLRAKIAGEDFTQAGVDAFHKSVIHNQSEFERLSDAGIKMFAVPRYVGERMDKFNPGGLIRSRGMRTFWDGPLNTWKSIVLTGSPRWVMNNMISNTIFLKLQGAKLTDVLRQADPGFNNLVKAITENAPGVDSGFFGDVATYVPNMGAAVESKVGQIANRVQESAALKPFHTWRDWMRRMSATGEDAFRSASYMTAIEREQVGAEAASMARKLWTSKQSLEDMYRGGFDEAKVARATDTMNSFLNDYDNQTPFARNITKRFIAPFWPFYKHAGGLVLKMPFEHPLKFRTLQLLNKMGQDLKPDGAPAWLQGAVPIGTNSDGSTKYLSTSAFNPFEGVTQSPVAIANPLVKVAFEQGTGVDSFTGRPFTDPNVVTPFGSSQQERIVQTPEGPVAEPIEHTQPGLLEHILSQVPAYQAAEQLIAHGKVYDSSTLLDALMGRAAVTTPEGGLQYPKGELQQVTGYVGYPTYNFDAVSYAQKQDELRQQALDAWYAAHPAA